MLRLPRKKQRRPKDAMAYIRPLAEHQVLRLPRKKQPRPTPCRAPNTAPATQKAAETKGRQGVGPLTHNCWMKCGVAQL